MENNNNTKKIAHLSIIAAITVLLMSMLCFSQDSYAYAADCSIDMPTSVFATNSGKTSCKLTWKKVKFADGYQVFQYNSKKKAYELKKTTNGIGNVKVTLTGLKKLENYYYKVRAYRRDAEGMHYGNYSNTVERFPLKKPNLIYKQKGKTKVKLKWNKITNANGYKVYRKQGKKWKNIKTLKGKSKISYTVKRLKKNKTYSFKVRAYRNTSKKKKLQYSSYSNIVDKKHPKAISTANTNKVEASIPVLTFHNFVTDDVKKSDAYKNDEWTASIKDFEEQMKYLSDNGYTTLSMDEFYDWYKGKINYPKKTVVITIDDGRSSAYTLAAPILKKYGIKATIFTIGKYLGEKQEIAEPEKPEPVEEVVNESVDNKSIVSEEIDVAKEETTQSVESEETLGKDLGTVEEDNWEIPDRLNWKLIEKMKEEYPNIEIQSHSFDLHYLANDKQAVFSKDRQYIMQDYEKMNNNGFKYMAYPYGAFNAIAVDSARNNGIKLAFGFGLYYRNATRNDPWYNINRVKINGLTTLADFKKKVQ